MTGWISTFITFFVLPVLWFVMGWLWHKIRMHRQLSRMWGEMSAQISIRGRVLTGKETTDILKEYVRP